MKKLLFFVSFLTTLIIINVVPCLADCFAGYYDTQQGWIVYRFADNSDVYYPEVHSDFLDYQLYGYMYYFGSGFATYEEAMEAATGVSAGYNSWGQVLASTSEPYRYINTFFKGSWVNYTQDDLPDYNPDTVPEEPEAGSDWLSDMWEWFLYVMGWGDDPSIIQIAGGDKVETEIVTPSPTPSPTPVPSPTPYSLDIIDQSTGQPVYTITGIPNNTYNIYEGDTNNNGSDFDIFDVDLKIGNGGTSKPKDDLNEVMRTNNDYIQEMDVSAVKDSFSVLPSEWFLVIGVLASMPIIAGIISKMLK